MKDFYKVSFLAKSQDGSAIDFVDAIVNKIQKWLEDKYDIPMVKGIIPDWTIFTTGGCFGNEEEFSKLFAETVCCDQIAWACRIIEFPPCKSEYIPRKWITEIGCQINNESEASISYSVQYDDMKEYSDMHLGVPTPNIPKVAKNLLSNKQWYCSMDGFSITAEDTLRKKYQGPMFGVNDCYSLSTQKNNRIDTQNNVGRKDAKIMSELSKLTGQDITYICQKIPSKIIREYFQKNSKAFNQIRPGFRPNAVSDEDAVGLMIRFYNRPFIRVFLQNMIKRWLQDIDNHRNHLEKCGCTSEEALLQTLPDTVFADNIDLYFTLCNVDCPSEYIALLKTALTMIRKVSVPESNAMVETENATAKVEELTRKVSQLQEALDKESSAHISTTQRLDEITTQNVDLQKSLSAAEARIDATTSKSEKMLEELERLRKLAKYSDNDAHDANESEYEHSSICQVFYDYNGQIWLSRLADIIDGKISRFSRIDDKPYYFENRDRLFWKDGPRDDGYIGIWHWNAVPNISDPSTDYVTTSFNKYGKIIEVIDLPDCRTYEDIVKYLSEEDIPYIPGQKYFFTLSGVKESIPGLLCNESDLEIVNGNVKLKATTCVLPQFAISSSDIITLNEKKYYQYTNLGLPQDIYHVRMPFEVVKEIVLSRATSTVLRQQGITRKEAQHCQSFLKELPTETLAQEIANTYGCPETEATKYVTDFITSAEAYLSETDMDVGILAVALSRSPDTVQKCKHLLESEWRTENEAMLKAANDTLDQVNQDSKDKGIQAKALEDTIIKLNAQITELESQIASKLQLATDVETKVAERIAAARENVADFICEMSFFSKHEPVSHTPDNAVTISEVSETHSMITRHNVVCRQSGAIDELEDFEEKLYCNFISLGYSKSVAAQMAQVVTFCICNKQPILCGSNGASIADAVSAMFHAKGAYEITIPLASEGCVELCKTLGSECIEDNTVILLNGVFDGYSLNSYSTVLQYASSWKNNCILIFSIDGIAPDSILNVVWDKSWFIDGDVGLTQFPRGELQGFDVCCDLTVEFEESELTTERKNLKPFYGIINNRAMLNYAGFMLASECELKKNDLLMMQILIQAKVQGKMEEVISIFESVGIELESRKILTKYR